MKKPLPAKIVRFSVNLLTAFAIMYGLIVSSFLVLHVLFGERWWPVGMFVSFAHLFILPALPLLVVLLATRRRRVALLQIIPALVFALSYGGFFVVRSVQATSNTPEISVLTYNLNKDNHDLQAIIADVRSFGADVVAFQELSVLQAAGLQKSLSDLYPYAALHPDLKNGFTGVGLLSRYPILSDRYWEIGLGHQRAELDINGVTVAVHNSHPPHPLGSLRYDDGGPRGLAIASALELTEVDTMPLLLVGDFNMTDQTTDYRRVTDHYQDTYREVGWGMGFTFPDFGVLTDNSFLPPLARIDYVFHNGDFQALDAQVGANSGGSDHRPLFARLAFAPKL